MKAASTTAHRTTEPKWEHVLAWGRTPLPKERSEALDRELERLAQLKPKEMAPAVAKALAEPDTREQVFRAVEWYSEETVEALDHAPRPAHVSAMAREILRKVEALLKVLVARGKSADLTIPRPPEWRLWPEDEVEAVKLALEVVMFPVRDRLGWTGVLAVGQLIEVLDKADTTTLDALCRALRAAGKVSEPGQPLQALLVALREACEVVRRSSQESRGRPRDEARQLVINELARIFRLHGGSGPRARGRRAFVDQVLKAAGIPTPTDAKKLGPLPS